MFKKISLSILFASSLSFIFNADANEISMESDGTIMEFNYLTVTDPQDFMMQVDKFDKSACAKKWRDESNVAVSLWSLRGSGSSHFILVVYENADMMQKGRAIFNSCKDSADMITTFKNNTDTDRSWNWIAENVVRGRNWTNDTAFIKYNFNVSEGHEGHYLAEWKELMSSAKLERIEFTPYCLRGFYITQSILNKIDLLLIAKNCGNSLNTIMKHYEFIQMESQTSELIKRRNIQEEISQEVTL